MPTRLGSSTETSQATSERHWTGMFHELRLNAGCQVEISGNGEGGWWCRRCNKPASAIKSNCRGGTVVCALSRASPLPCAHALSRQTAAHAPEPSRISAPCMRASATTETWYRSIIKSTATGSTWRLVTKTKLFVRSGRSVARQGHAEERRPPPPSSSSSEYFPAQRKTLADIVDSAYRGQIMSGPPPSRQALACLDARRRPLVSLWPSTPATA
jgi:hypothetical protein